jgi:DNA polymerase-3 subunit beta
MLDFLRATPEANVAFHFRDAQSAGELRPSGGDGAARHRYVIMPMRI